MFGEWFTARNLPRTDAIFDRFGGIDGSAYIIGGFGMTALTANNIVIVPIRSGVGLRLARVAWRGIQATAGLIVRWNARQLDLVERNPALSATMWGLAVRGPGDRRVGPDQWRSMLFFRAAPGLFVLAWTTLTVIALVIRH